MAIVLYKGNAFKICNEFSYLHELENGWGYVKGEKPEVTKPEVTKPEVTKPKTPKSKAMAFEAKPKGDPKTVTPASKTDPLKAESKVTIFSRDPK